MEGKGVRVHRGCKQGAPESPTLWNLVLDETLEIVIGQVAAATQGRPTADARGRPQRKTPFQLCHRVEHCNRLAFADDILLFGTSAVSPDHAQGNDVGMRNVG